MSTFEGTSCDETRWHPPPLPPPPLLPPFFHAVSSVEFCPLVSRRRLLQRRSLGASRNLPDDPTSGECNHDSSGLICTWKWLTSWTWRFKAICKLCSDTYGSNTSLVMYSFGILGSWYENTFCKPTSHRRVCREGCLLNEFPTTWNSMTPLRSSHRAASSLALWVPGYRPP